MLVSAIAAERKARREAEPDVAAAETWWNFFRSRGMNPIPSRRDKKQPPCRYAQWWEETAPADLFSRFPSTNLQVMTGRHWRLIVIDLDGPEAIERWSTMGRTPRTWVTHSGGGGRHLWFRLPAGLKHPITKAFLWRGDDKHSAIERLCDRSLVMAPPSIHPTAGERYRFLDKANSPITLPFPADCPRWVFGLKPISYRIDSGEPKPRSRFDATVLQGRAVELARSWGVRFTGHVSAKGWAECHAFDRPDDKPSAAIHQDSGFYVDQGSNTKLSLIDLGIALNAFRDREDAYASLGVYAHVG